MEGTRSSTGGRPRKVLWIGGSDGYGVAVDLADTLQTLIGLHGPSRLRGVGLRLRARSTSSRAW